MEAPGGIDMALATYNIERALTIHKKIGSAELIVEAYRTNSFLTLDDDQEFLSDTQPEIVPFGAPPVPAKAANTAKANKVQPLAGIGIGIGPKVGRAVVGSLTSAGQLRLTRCGMTPACTSGAIGSPSRRRTSPAGNRSIATGLRRGNHADATRQPGLIKYSSETMPDL